MGGCLGNDNYVSCPHCGHIYNRSQETTHACNKRQVHPQQQQKAGNSNQKWRSQPQIQSTPLTPIFYPPPNPLEPRIYYGQAKEVKNQYIQVKVPSNPQRTLFQWKREPTYFYPTNIKLMSPEIIKTRTFQEKMLWFRLKIQQLRISWQHGHAKLVINRGKLLQSCREGLTGIHWRQEVKIIFDDEDVEDAGGVIREWMNLVIKEVFSPETGVFELCDTQQTAYRFVWDKDLNEHKAQDIAWVLGIIIGKALFDRISIDCHLNKTLLRQICSSKVFIHDVFSYDQKLFQAWWGILKMKEEVEELCLNFSEFKIHKDGTGQEIDLIPKGREVPVTDKNKRQYILQEIQLHTQHSCSNLINALKAGVFRVVPPELLTIFEPHELEIILCGPQTINVLDWRQNTQYKGYKYNDQVIEWFWAVVGKMDQKKLTNLLHYCTGSTRVPILGFKYLESNRNNVAKFTIQRINYSPKDPYPKSYTCFNRLELPNYPSYKELEKSVNVIVKEELSHFGLA